MKSPAILTCQWFPPLVLLICSLLLYVQTFSGSWLMDDIPVIVNNPDILSFGKFLANSFPGRPLRELSFLLDYSLFGLEPWGYHFQNIFWHALNCWLLYLLAIRLKLSITVAWLSALLFLVHPIHVEVVANSSHRKDSLALAFLLMALLFYIKSFEPKITLQRILFLCCTLAFWVTAFYAKGNSIVFPAIVIAYEYALVPEDKRLFVKWKNMVPFLALLSVIAIIGWYFYISSLPSFKYSVIGAFIKNESLDSFSTVAYLSMVLKSYAFMLSKLILPLDLSMEYIYAVPKSLLDPWVVSALITIPAICVMALKCRKSYPQLFFLMVSSAILWLPTANIVWYFSYFAADRYMYAPSAGLCIMTVLLSERVFTVARRYFVIGWLAILCTCTFLSWKQTAVWHDEMSLYSQMLKVSPRSLEAMVGLSSAYFSVKNYDMSALYAQQAIARDPTDERPFVNLGTLYDVSGKTDMAIEMYKTALKLRPENFNIYVNLGVTYERANKLAEAELALNKALTLDNNFVPAWFNLGVVRYRKNDYHGARIAFSEVLTRDPSHPDALANLSVVCKEIGDDACYKDAVRRMTTEVPGATGN